MKAPVTITELLQTSSVSPDQVMDGKIKVVKFNSAKLARFTANMCREIKRRFVTTGFDAAGNHIFVKSERERREWSRNLLQFLDKNLSPDEVVDFVITLSHGGFSMTHFKGCPEFIKFAGKYRNLMRKASISRSRP